jgi:hypothetical protein
LPEADRDRRGRSLAESRAPAGQYGKGWRWTAADHRVLRLSTEEARNLETLSSQIDVRADGWSATRPAGLFRAAEDGASGSIPSEPRDAANFRRVGGARFDTLVRHGERRAHGLIGEQRLKIRDRARESFPE